MRTNICVWFLYIGSLVIYVTSNQNSICVIGFENFIVNFFTHSLTPYEQHLEVECSLNLIDISMHSNDNKYHRNKMFNKTKFC